MNSTSPPANVSDPPATREQRFPKRVIPVVGLLLLLLVTNAVGSLSHIDAAVAWRDATPSRIVTWSLNVISVLFGAVVIYGLFRRRSWSVTAAKWFIGLYYVAMVAKHTYFSPLARFEPLQYAVVYGIVGTICLGFVLLLCGRRVNDYFDR